MKKPGNWGDGEGRGQAGGGEPEKPEKVSTQRSPEGALLKGIPPGTPLTLKHAAIACGVRVRRVGKIADTKLFQDALRCEIAARRESEDPRNLAVAIEIRDDPGDGSPKAMSTRLKAIDTIRGKEPVHAVQVNVGQRCRRQRDAWVDYQTR